MIQKEAEGKKLFVEFETTMVSLLFVQRIIRRHRNCKVAVSFVFYGVILF